MVSGGMFLRKPHTELLFGLGLFALLLAGLATLIAFTGWGKTWAAISALGALQIGILLGLSCANYILRALRWHIFTRALGLDIPLLRNSIIYFAGFALTITPGRVGELVRLRWVQRETGKPLLQASSLILGDRAADLAGVALLLLLAAVLAFGGGGGVYGVVAVALAVAVMATHPGFLGALVTRFWKMLGHGARFFASLRRAVRRLSLFTRAKVALPTLALSLCGWLSESYAFYLLLGWLGADIGFWMATGIFLFSMLGGGATGLPGGLGGAEAAMVALLSLQNLPLETAIAATLVIRATTLWFAILIGFGVFPFAEQKRAR